MAKGGGGTFSSWLKEFCTIVLIQSLQAFLFAIVVVLIVTSYNQSKSDEQTKALGLGVVGVVGLASLSKIESLVKEMLGVKSKLMDPSMNGGMKSLATAWMAAKMARGALDNPKKIVSGIGAKYSGAKDKARVKKRHLAYLDKMGVKNGGSPIDTAQASLLGINPTGTAGTTTVGGTTQSAGGTTQVSGGTTQVSGGTTQSNGGTTRVSGGTIQVDGNSVQVNGQGVNAASAQNPNNLTRKDQIDVMKAVNDYDDKIAEIKSKQKDGTKSILKGTLGTVGSTVGGLGGAAAGAALGEVKEIVQLAGGGIGLGDAIGEKMVDVAYSVKSATSGIKGMKDTRNQNKLLDKAISEQRQAVTENFEQLGMDISDQYSTEALRKRTNTPSMTNKIKERMGRPMR